MDQRHTYKPFLFFIIALSITSIAAFFASNTAGVEGKEGETILFQLIGLLGPAVTAILLIIASDSRALKKDFVSRLFSLRRMRLFPFLLILIVPPIVVFLATSISLQFGQPADQFKMVSDTEQLIPMIILAIFLAPTIEELGWRGYGMDSIRAKLGPLSASLVFGALWSLWHFPLIFIEGTYHYELAHLDTPVYLINFFVSVMALAIFVNWIYYKNNRSILALIIMHASANWWSVSLETTHFTNCIITAIYIVLGILLVVIDRKEYSGGPRSYLEETAP